MAQSTGGRPQPNENRGRSFTPPNGGQYTGQQPVQGQKRTLTPEQKRARIKRRQELLRRRRRHRRIFFAVIFLVLVLGAFFLIRHFTATESQTIAPELDELDGVDEDVEAEQNYDGPPEATISFVGDISTSKDQVAAVTKSDGTYDFSKVFEELEPYFSESDYAVGNFETTLTDAVAYGTEPYYNSPVQLAGALRTLGFRLMSTANTYMLNNGIEGLTSTKQYLSQAKLQSVGTYLSQADRDKNGGAYIRTIHKIKFAFLSYTKGTDSVRMPEGCEYALNTLYSDYSDYWTDLKSSQIRADIQAAKDAGAEVIVALVHWGSEYGRTISEPQRTVESLMLQNGVDVIIGTHPHVVGEMGYQTVERTDGTTKECFVAYSLGDFYTDPAQEDAQNSAILNLTFSKNSNGGVVIQDARYIPIYQNITEQDGKRQFQLLDVYEPLADLRRNVKNLTADEARLYNKLLDTVTSLHSSAGEELDAGPTESDRRFVEQALEAGAISTSQIKALEQEEKKPKESGAPEEGSDQEPEAPLTSETPEE